MSQRANILLSEFGAAQNVNDMKFNDNGVCSFFIDEKFDITLMVDNDERIFLYGLICKADIEEASKYALVLLSANVYLYGSDNFSCCYDHKSTSFALLKCINIDGANAFVLNESVEKMVDAMRSLQDSMADMGFIEQ
ncbi:CesT family type III secretion system chaperone [Enterobacter asburiae]|uniref:CesT family type III secretion system chaperone n=1 Tax=Enterobacter asburiae TaxID=61645 RepID=UPI00200673B7|nr:CesT family type III secretion system chaperone [Enterobacter asburiae]MCK7227248.1 CesT family type III secretion system chaperone [Enterobacter asburiae]